MNKIIICLIFLFVSVFSKAQINDNCINAIPLCSTPSFTFNANSGPGSIVDFSTTSTISNPSVNPNPPNSGCLHSGELNPQWLLITIGNAGMLEFVFGAGNSANPQAGCYDWAMWPYSPATCSGIFNNTLPPIRCNWNGDCGPHGTGIASAANYTTFGGSSTNFEAPLAVNACQQFVICISNYSGVNTLVSFQSLGTASLSCSPNCNPSYSICNGSSATIVPVNFAALANPVFSIQPGGMSNTTGSFVVSPTVTTSYTTYITGANQVNAIETINAVSTVTVYSQPSAAPTITQTTCSSTLNAVNLNLSFTSPTPAPSYSVVWSPPMTGATSTAQTSYTGGISPGTYIATITTANGCVTYTNVTINPIPAPPAINLAPINTSHTITCLQPTVVITSLDPTNTYTWSNGLIAPITGSVASLTGTATGIWTITAVNPVSGCASTKTFAVMQDITPPTSVMSPSFQNITCNLASISTVTASANPTVNITHQILSPLGGTFTANSHTVAYLPGGVGIFTYCVVNDVNGCSTCKTFTVASNQGFPTYSVVSAENFTLGCGSRSTAVISIINGNTTPPGGSISYTLLPPGSSTTTPSGTLSLNSTYTVSAPGTWTVVTKDNLSLCETRNPISILSNTFAPNDSVTVPRLILNCDVPRITLKGASKTSNVNYNWSFPGTPGNQPGDTITIYANFGASSSSVIANYTLTITDNSSTCKSTTVIPMRQNIYPPIPAISNGGTFSLTCSTNTIMLTNLSKTGIPQTTGFPDNQQVIGYLWDGPTPQEQGHSSSTYIAATVGVYTMTAKDLNNGCTSQTTTVIGDNRIYPIITNKTPRPNYILDCGSSFVQIGPVFPSGTNPYSYSWSYPPGASITPVASGSITTNSIGVYREVVTNTVNGCATLIEYGVSNGSLTVAFEAQPVTGYAPLNVTFFNNSASSTTIQSQASSSITAYWNFANGTSSITTSSNLSPASTYSLPGTYVVRLFATKGTCLDTAEMTIHVDIPSELAIPNVFTPNGDGANDVFFLKSTNLQEINILIFDRWGHKVYELISETGNIAWDGKNQAGKEVADGTYFYIIKARGKDGTSFDKKGTVSLYR